MPFQVLHVLGTIAGTSLRFMECSPHLCKSERNMFVFSPCTQGSQMHHSPSHGMPNEAQRCVISRWDRLKCAGGHCTVASVLKSQRQTFRSGSRTRRDVSCITLLNLLAITCTCNSFSFRACSLFEVQTECVTEAGRIQFGYSRQNCRSSKVEAAASMAGSAELGKGVFQLSQT